MLPKGPERRLTTILSADVVGYSWMMGRDEGSTLAALKAHRRQLIAPKAAQYHGRTVKLMGDGALMDFPSVVDAVTFAVEIQMAMAERNAEIPEDRQIVFRIGLNIGDIIVEGDDIYGDGVNVASRLEKLADPGGICIARNVYSQVKDKLGLTFESMGPQAIKNIAEPISAYRVVLDERATALATPAVDLLAAVGRRKWSARAVLAGAIPAILIPVLALYFGSSWITEPGMGPSDDFPIIAVRLFQGPQDQQAAPSANELSGEVVARLGRFPLLHVVFDTEGTSPPADFVLSGNIRSAGDTIIASVQLVDNAIKSIAFSQTYSRDTRESRQDDGQQWLAAQIATDVGSSYSGAVGAADYARAAQKPVEILSAYECYLHGLRVFGAGDDRTTRRARECLEARVGSQSNDATAWALLASTYAHQRWWAKGLESPERDHIDNRVHLAEMARKAAARADSLADGRSPIIYFAIGRALYAACESDKIMPVAERAIRLNPADANVLGSFGNWVAYLGYWDEGLAWAEEAVRMAPDTYAKWWWWPMGKDAWRKGEYDRALHAWTKAHQENVWLTHMYLAMIYAETGRQEDARTAVDRLLELKPDFSARQAAAYYRMWCFPDDYIAKLQHDLRKAGVPE